MGMFGGCRELRETDVVLVATAEPFCCLLDLGAKQLRVSQVPSILLAGKSWPTYRQAKVTNEPVSQLVFKLKP
jgi:hypothetical protein